MLMISLGVQVAIRQLPDKYKAHGTLLMQILSPSESYYSKLKMETT